GHSYLFVNPKLAGKYMLSAQDHWAPHRSAPWKCAPPKIRVLVIVLEKVRSALTLVLPLDPGYAAACEFRQAIQKLTSVWGSTYALLASKKRQETDGCARPHPQSDPRLWSWNRIFARNQPVKVREKDMRLAIHHGDGSGHA